MEVAFRVRDLRSKERYKIDDAYLDNGFAKSCGVYATAVYNSLCRHANSNQESWPSIERMMEQHGITKPSIIKGIKALEAHGIISVSRERNDQTKRQEVNVYSLMDPSMWQSRVNDIDPEPGKPHLPSRVNVVTKSRVNHIDRKVAQVLKVTHKKVTQVQYDDPLFQELWKLYPRGDAKLPAWKEFLKLKPSEREQLIPAVRKHMATRQWTDAGGRYVPHLRTFLSQRRWEDHPGDRSPDTGVQSDKYAGLGIQVNTPT